MMLYNPGSEPELAAMFAIVPYQVDVGMVRWPIANFILIAAIVVAYPITTSAPDPEAIRPYVLEGWSLQGLLGHVFLHSGAFHLLGNVVFLWAFGNAICAKVGNLAYIPLFLFFGVASATVHLLADGRPAVGASGAINGVVGMYLMFYPMNNVSCAYWFIFRVGTFYLSGIWILLLFFGFDVWGALNGTGHVAYWAHIGGFVTGFTIATIGLLTGILESRRSEDTLLELLGFET